MGFMIICNKCGNRNKMASGYRGMITKEEIDIEAIEDFSSYHTTVECVAITCYNCGNEIQV